ncbi:MAG: signal peptidase II [Thiovulaceae bacterium]|nr:signal peptidase II [Sulfurimonadaceae bacterium]
MRNSSYKLILTLVLSMSVIFLADQAIKEFFLSKAMEMYSVPESFLYTHALDLYETAYVNMRLVFNYGVAFSLFSFLETYLKWIQFLLISGAFVYVIRLNKMCYALPSGILIGAGLSNIYDRFIHGGVVDYVYWHYGFNFAIFNFADVMIDLAVAWILLLNLKPRLCK